MAWLQAYLTVMTKLIPVPEIIEQAWARSAALPRSSPAGWVRRGGGAVIKLTTVLP
jgi:hypothetical protein